jgi:hypothetical protein
MVARKIGKHAKRLLLAAGLALLLPGVAGAAGFGPAEPSFWEWAQPAALFGRLWDGLTGLWTSGGAATDPNGEGTNGGATAPGGEGANGAGVCVGDCGPSIDPNG